MHSDTPIPCAACGYDLRGVKIGDNCPECGATVSQYPIRDEAAGKAVASMVLGILSIVTCMMYGLPGLICGILAMVYAKRARLAVQSGHGHPIAVSMARAGRICGLIGMILGLVFFVFIALYMIFIFVFVGFAAWGAGRGAPPTPTPFPIP